MARTRRSSLAIAAVVGHAVETPDRAAPVVGQYGNQAGPDKLMDV